MPWAVLFSKVCVLPTYIVVSAHYPQLRWPGGANGHIIGLSYARTACELTHDQIFVAVVNKRTPLWHSLLFRISHDVSHGFRSIIE